MSTLFSYRKILIQLPETVQSIKKSETELLNEK